MYNSYVAETGAVIDELTGKSILDFKDKGMNLKSYIKATFDKMTVLNTGSGKIIRLYKASFNLYLIQMEFDIG